MFTTNPRMRHLFPSEGKYLLVTHAHDDVDACTSIDVFLLFLGKTLKSPNIRVAFVPHGQIYRGEVLLGERVIHFDTGGLLDPENGFFDHHFEDCKYYSATAIVIDLFFQRTDYSLQNIQNFVDRIDSGNKVNSLTEEQWGIIEVAKELLAEEGNFARVSPNYRGPHWLSEILSTFVPDIPEKEDYERLDFAIKTLRSYRRKFERNEELQPALAKMEITKYEETTFALIPKNSVRRADLRYWMRNNYMDNVDIYVTEFTPGSQNSSPTKFAVTIINDDSLFEGMDELKAQLWEADQNPQKGELDNYGFIYPRSQFVLYIHDYNCTLPLEEVFDRATKTLRRKKEEQAQVAA